MRYQKKGSVLFLVLTVIAVLTLWSSILFRSIALTYDLSCQRYWYEQKMAACEGVINYGIALCKQNFHALTASDGPYSMAFNVGQWNVQNKKVAGKLVVTVDKKKVILGATLGKESQNKQIIQCTVSEESDAAGYEGEKTKRQFLISEWRIGEKNENKKK